MARAAFFAAGVGMLAIAVLVLLDFIEPEVALAGAALGLVGLMLLALLALPYADIQKHVGRVKSLTLGSLGVELADYVSLAGRGVPGEEFEESDPGTAITLLELRSRLELKLTYLAKHVLAPNPEPENLVPTFVTIGSLNYDGYLTDDQARVASDILSMREYEFRSLSEPERTLFLEGASRFVASFRIEVFSAQVKVELTNAGWEVLPVLEPTARRDLLVESKSAEDGTRHHIIPVFAMEADSGLLRRPTRRLKEEPFAKCGGARYLVVPPRSQAAGHTTEGGIRIVTLPQLLKALADGLGGRVQA